MPPWKKTHTDSPGPTGVDYDTFLPSSSNDDRGLWFLHEEVNRMCGDINSPPEQSNEKTIKIDTEVDVIKSFEEQVIVDGKNSLYIVIRRGASLDRTLALWRRAAAKVTAEHVELNSLERMALMMEPLPVNSWHLLL